MKTCQAQGGTGCCACVHEALVIIETVMKEPMAIYLPREAAGEVVTAAKQLDHYGQLAKKLHNAV
jgi:hypothetical protein